MLNQEILDCCKRLRLSRNLAELAQSTEGETHQEYLHRLLCAEIGYREHCRTGKLLHDAGFYTRKTFDGFHFEEVTFPGTLTAEQLKTLDFIREKKNVILYGNQGTGKTFLSIALGVAACQTGLPVRFFRTAALVNQLSEAKASGTLGAFVKKLEKAELLILDEWGYVPLDRMGSQLLFEVLSACYERKSVILNTNLEFSKWVNVLYDEQMTAALLDRLLHHCHLLLFPGSSHRMRESSIHELSHSMSSKR